MQNFSFHEIYYLINTYIRGMWRHRWHMVVVSWVVCLGGWVTTSMMEDQYGASGRLVIEDPQKDISPFLTDVTNRMDVTSEARRILNRIINRTNLLSVIRQTDWAYSISTPRELEEALQTLRMQVSVSPIGGSSSNLYVISHRHTNPKIAYQVVKGLLDLLMRDSIDQVTAYKARTAQRFLDVQINEYKEKVEQAERELQEFKRRNAPSLPDDDKGGYYVRLKQLMNVLDTERLKEREMGKRQEELQRQLTRMQGHNPQVQRESSALDKKIEETHQRLQDLRSKYYMKGARKLPLYPEDHPDVVSLRRSISQLQEDKRQEAENRLSPQMNDEKSIMDEDPIYRQVQLAMSEVKVDLASTRARIDEYTNQLDGLRGLENTLPAIEAELIRLERNYNITREKLLSLLSKQGEARFSGDVAESLSAEVQFKIVDPPEIPLTPIGPNRPLFLTVALIGGILSGMAIALVLAILRPVFDSPVTLKKTLGLPVLGTVSMIKDGPGQAWLASKFFFFLANALLVGLYVLILTFTHLM
ncbi:MAG: hypothetical protein HQL54_04970 [Magnetococcales bacterium]|nr:hypothetical protein [Magnetococcales bacterium]